MKIQTSVPVLDLTTDTGKSGSVHLALVDREDPAYSAIRSQGWPPVHALRQLGLGLGI